MIEFIRKERLNTFTIVYFRNDGKLVSLYLYKRTKRSMKELNEWRMMLNKIYFNIPRRKPIFDSQKKMGRHKKTIGRYL